MDFKRMNQLHIARSEFVAAANSNLPERQIGQIEGLVVRYKDLVDRMSKFVEHRPTTAFFESGLAERSSASRLVGILNVPMPYIYVKFSYLYTVNDGTMSSVSNGVFNDYGENVKEMSVNWVHYADDNAPHPSDGSSNIPVMTGYGEVFATEKLSYNELRLLKAESLDSKDLDQHRYGFHPSVKMALLEQSMDQYEAAPPSPYELRLGLAEA